MIDAMGKTVAAWASEELQVMFHDRLKVLVAGLLALSIAGVAAFGLRQARADEAAKATDEKKIAGTWTVVSFEEGGEKAKKETIKGVEVTFTEDGKYTVKQGAKEQDFTHTLDATKKPKEFNGTNSKGHTVAGIYKLEGKKLTVCFARRGDRPTEFVSDKGTSVVLIVLERPKD
jgi:uncharacterized protein (TIGR03067 family)